LGPLVVIWSSSQLEVRPTSKTHKVLWGFATIPMHHSQEQMGLAANLQAAMEYPGSTHS